MKVYLKVHIRDECETIACCDEDLINQVYVEGKLRIEISNQFYGGKLVNLEEAIDILKHSSFFNIVGKHIIEQAILNNLLSKEGVRIINGIPMALKMMF
ncbi:MAG: DUF424 family protein [Promethearchaeota archaeon]|jgi:hypothetical protein